MIRFPIPDVELGRLRDLLPATKPERPYAFILGHGLWNDLDLQATVSWLDTILETIVAAAPWLQPSLHSGSSRYKAGKAKSVAGDRSAQVKPKPGFWPRLFMTPNAAGKAKPDEWLVSQGNKALMIFEESMKVEAEKRGVEHVGTWNMTIQANLYDGV